METRPGMPDPDGAELEDESLPRRSGLSGRERVFAVTLSVVLLVGGVGILGRALWRVATTALQDCEMPIELPTRYEVPGIDDQSVAVSGGFNSGRFVLCGVDTGARAQLAISQVLDAGIISALILTIAVLGFRVVLNRSFYRGLFLCSSVSGVVIVAFSLVSRSLRQSSLTVFAKQVREGGIGSVFPQDVDVPVDWPIVGAGLSLLLLAIVLGLAHRTSRELEGVI